MASVSVNSAYCKESNSIWLDQISLVRDAILGILVSRHIPDEYSLEKNGRWDTFFQGVGHEFGHFLFKSEFESIGAGDFVNHRQSRAHQLGERYSRFKSDDFNYVNNFFSLLLPKS